MTENKAVNKTLPTTFDLQMKQNGSRKGVSFVLRRGNNIEFVNIPTVPEQKFQYFFNPSRLTAEERKLFLQGKAITKVIEDDEP